MRLHARDAESADRDLREALSIRMTALGGRPPAGALVFACNGRGRSMFGRADHDAEALADALAGAPAAGFFAAGEIGPVGGGYFLHSLHGDRGGVRLSRASRTPPARLARLREPPRRRRVNLAAHACC